MICGSKSEKLPLFTTFGSHGVVDPKLGSGGPLNQVLHFFLRGVYTLAKKLNESGEYRLTGLHHKVLLELNGEIPVQFQKHFISFNLFARVVVHTVLKMKGPCWFSW